MTATTRAILVLLSGLVGLSGQSTPSHSQDTRVWSDVDCSDSKLIVPNGFKCRATQLYSGGTGTADAGAGGQFRQWSASATVNNIRLYYYVHEAIGGRSTVTTTESLETRIRQLGAKGDKNFTPTAPMAGGDYVRYEGPAGQPCVGIRKYGPSTTAGFKWILVGTRCGQKGMTLSDQDIAAFIASAKVRA
jgi:hypothetical protein